MKLASSICPFLAIGRKMHWHFLLAMANVGLFLLVVGGGFGNASPVAESYAVWLTAGATAIGAGVSGFAAVMLRDALLEQRNANKYMELQLQQNRAYMTFDGLTIEPRFTKRGDFSRCRTVANWRNSGNSPGINVSAVSFVVTDMRAIKSIDPLRRLLNGPFESVGPLRGSVSICFITDDEIREGAAAPTPGVFLYSACLYRDIYGQHYLAEHTQSILVPEDVFDCKRWNPPQIIGVGHSPRCGEHPVSKLEMEIGQMSLDWVERSYLAASLQGLSYPESKP